MAQAEIQVDGMTELEKQTRKAAVDVEAKRQVLSAATELRDELIVKLYDSGVSVARAARVSLVSMQRVLQIVARKG